MENIKDSNVGAIVAQDYRAAAVFKKYGIDFCCNGNIPLSDACQEHKIDLAQIENELQDVLSTTGQKADNVTDYKAWPLDLLADYIEKKHHRYVNEQIPLIQGYLEKICSVHGGRHPELHQIKELFNESVGEFTMHMKKEELMLFPFVRKMMQAGSAGNKPLTIPFGTVQSPIRMMMHEHDAEGERFRKMRHLSDNYALPHDACNTYRVTYALLDAFESDLHLHIHLENNILFPGAIALEDKLAGQLDSVAQ